MIVRLLLLALLFMSGSCQVLVEYASCEDVDPECRARAGSFSAGLQPSQFECREDGICHRWGGEVCGRGDNDGDGLIDEGLSFAEKRILDPQSVVFVQGAAEPEWFAAEAGGWRSSGADQDPLDYVPIKAIRVSRETVLVSTGSGTAGPTLTLHRHGSTEPIPLTPTEGVRLVVGSLTLASSPDEANFVVTYSAEGLAGPVTYVRFGMISDAGQLTLQPETAQIRGRATGTPSLVFLPVRNGARPPDDVPYALIGLVVDETLTVHRVRSGENFATVAFMIDSPVVTSALALDADVREGEQLVLAAAYVTPGGGAANLKVEYRRLAGRTWESDGEPAQFDDWGPLSPEPLGLFAVGRGRASFVVTGRQGMNALSGTIGENTMLSQDTDFLLAAGRPVTSSHFFSAPDGLRLVTTAADGLREFTCIPQD